MVGAGKNKNYSPKTLIIKIWDEFIYGGHYLAFGDAVAIYAIGIVCKIPVTWTIFVVIYLCIFAANLLNRSDESDSDTITNPTRVKVMRKYTKHFNAIVIFCLSVSTVFLLYYASIGTFLFALFIIAIAALYTILLKGFTKYIIGFKNYIAALFYALMVFLLAYYYKFPVNTAVIIIFFFYYLRIFISSAACDIKDIEGDELGGLKTIAIYFGKKNATRLLNVVNILSGILIVWGVYIEVLPVFSYGLLLTIPYASYYLYRGSKSKNKEFFSNVIIDGEFLLWLPYVILARAIL